MNSKHLGIKCRKMIPSAKSVLLSFMLLLCIAPNNKVKALDVWDGTIDGSKFGDIYTSYYIYTGAELMGMIEFLNDHQNYGIGCNFYLMDDIQLNANVLNADGTLTSDTSNLKKCLSIEQFNENFHGGGHTIYGMYLNNDNTKNGFFKILGSNSAVDSLHFVDSYVRGKEDVGGIAGYIFARELRHCSFNGLVEGEINVGGVAGHIYNGAHLINCVNYAKVVGKETVGGICGYSDYDTDIANSYNEGNIQGTKNVGGVAGVTYWTNYILNSYNIGNVAGSENVGGVIGYVEDCKRVYACFSYPKIENIKVAYGGLFGKIGAAYIDTCYYNSDFNDSVGVDWNVSRLVGLTQAQFNNGYLCHLLNSSEQNTIQWGQNLSGDGKQEAPVFNGEKVYFYNGCYMNCRTHDYLQHKDELAPTCTYGMKSHYRCLVCGAYLNDDKQVCTLYDLRIPALPHDYHNGFCSICNAFEPASKVVDNGAEWYEISNAGQLYWFSDTIFNGNSALNGRLVSNVTINPNVLNSIDNHSPSTETFRTWNPIGGERTKKHGPNKVYYSGIFDGQGYVISGLYQNESIDNYAGLVGLAYGATIKNVGVVDSYFKGRFYVGAICGNSMMNNTITSCYSLARVSGIKHVGSMIGTNMASSIANCYYDQFICSTKGIDECDELGQVEGLASSSFASGEACYLLNGKQGSVDNVWHQTLVSQAYPQASGQVVYSGFSGSCKRRYSNSPIVSTSYSHSFGADGICTVCGEYKSAPTVVANDTTWYTIATIGQLLWFANEVNSGRNDLNAKLTADIVYNSQVFGADGAVLQGLKDWTPILGESLTNSYSGVFDGQCHTISGLYVNSNKYYVGMFASCEGTLRNIGVTNSFFKGKCYVGGLCGMSKNANFQNCYSTAVVDGDIYAASLCGYSLSSNYDNCFYNTDLVDNGVHGQTLGIDVVGKTTSQFKSGEVCFLLNEGNGMNAWGQTLSNNTHLSPTASGLTIYASGARRCSNDILSLVYSNTQQGLTTGNHNFTNGFCDYCGELQSITPVEEDGVVWYDIVNAGQLYWFAHKANTDSPAINGRLTNDITINSQVLDQEGNLVADSASLRRWEPIGFYNGLWVAYKGMFDGNGHTISGLYLNDSQLDLAGLFGNVSGATIKNLTLSNSYINGQSMVGGICGFNNGGTIAGCTNKATVKAQIGIGGGICGNNSGTITNSSNVGKVDCVYGAGGICGNNLETVSQCFNNGMVDVQMESAGGICAVNFGTIEKSFNLSKIVGHSKVGGVCGKNEKSAILKNCYSIGEVTGVFNYGAIFGSSLASVQRCYYYIGAIPDNVREPDKPGQVYGLPMELFKNGEACYKLNEKSSSPDVVWRQNLETDSYPSFAGNIVYKCGSIHCENMDDGAHYSNVDEGLVVGEHNYVNGICSYCNTYQPVVPVVEEGTEWYDIANMGQLYSFAEMVNSTDPTINGRLVADVFVNDDLFYSNGDPCGAQYNYWSGDFVGINNDNPVAWTPIGCQDGSAVVDYSGTFDGQGHFVSGLFFNNTSQPFVGLFGRTRGASIKNVGVKNSVFVANEKIAALCGFSFNSSINKCYVESSFVYGFGISVSCICGETVSSSIADCYSLNSKEGGSDRTGGIVGELGEQSTLYNCYVNGRLFDQGGYNGAVVGIGENVIDNCFYNNELTSMQGLRWGIGEGEFLFGKPSADFASGEVCYLLNKSNSSNNVVWRQTIGTDVSPKLYGDVVYKLTLIDEANNYESVVYANSGNITLPQLESEGKISLWYTQPNGYGKRMQLSSELNSDATLYAYYMNDGSKSGEESVAIIVEADNGLGIGSGLYDYGSKVLISAQPNKSATFVGWSDGVTDLERTIEAVNDMNLIAIFAKDETNVYEKTHGYVYSQKSTIIIEGTTSECHIFNMSGVEVYSGTDRQISVSPGVYVVRIGSEVTRVVVL
ncbi:MAG: hypothetical protein MJ069_07880 [Salinivirgaceae bacterium]|nr:hypothetical protein [Salinivirgaceae bacterium]